jgi:hypothetical protein
LVIEAFAVKAALSVGGLAGTYPAGTTSISFTLTNAQPGESFTVSAQKRTTDTNIAGNPTKVDGVTSLCTVDAAATAPTTKPISSPGTSAAGIDYDWINVQYIVNAK